MTHHLAATVSSPARRARHRVLAALRGVCLMSCASVSTLLAQARNATPRSRTSVHVYRDGRGLASLAILDGSSFGLLLDVATGMSGGLRFNASGTEAGVLALGAGSAMTPTPMMVRFDATAGDTTVVLTGAGAERRLRRVPVHAENISFTRDALTIAGSFVRPVTGNRHPVILLLNGSGPSSRGQLANIAGLLAASGIAALVCDKPGTGASSGTYTTDKLRELTADAEAALRYLASRADVDTSHLGVLGQSQGTWIALMLAARNPGVKFIISTSGGALPAEQEIFARVNIVADSGYDIRDQEDARRFLTRLFTYYASGRKDSTNVSALYQQSKDAKWYPLVRGPGSDPTVGEWPPARTAFAEDLALDWKSIYAAVKAHVYALNSADDRTVPALLSHERLKTYLPGGARQVTTRLAHGDHGFGIKQADGTPRLDALYLSSVIEWAKRATRR